MWLKPSETEAVSCLVSSVFQTALLASGTRTSFLRKCTPTTVAKAPKHQRSHGQQWLPAPHLVCLLDIHAKGKEVLGAFRTRYPPDAAQSIPLSQS